jgi:hypothetical protein
MGSVELSSNFFMAIQTFLLGYLNRGAGMTNLATIFKGLMNDIPHNGPVVTSMGVMTGEAALYPNRKTLMFRNDTGFIVT